MKTNEFKQAVEELGFNLVKVGNNGEHWYIYHHGVIVGLVIPLEFMVLTTKFEDFPRLNVSQRTALGALLFEYAATPLDEREPERKWYLRDPITGQYLNIDQNGKATWNNYKYESNGWQASYTRAEIEAFTFEHAHLIEDEVTE